MGKRTRGKTEISRRYSLKFLIFIFLCGKIKKADLFVKRIRNSIGG